MDKSLVAAIEFGSKKLKVVVGYELDGQCYVVYTLTKPYGRAVEAGQIVDAAAISNSLLEVKEFVDSSAKLHIVIDDALLCLPPERIDVYETSETTTVITEGGKIGSFDIKNLYALIKNRGLPTNCEMVDVCPRKFILDENREFDRVPLGEISNYISVYAKIHTLPHEIPFDYKNALTSSGVSPKRLVIAPHAAIELIATYDDLPSDYFLVDIGSNTTTISLVGARDLFNSIIIDWGGDDITERIADQFHISFDEAEKYKIMYGLDNREMNFKAPVCTSKDEEGFEEAHYQSELLEVIKNELENLVRRLRTSVDQLVGDNTQLKNLPMLLIGGGSYLYGFEKYLGPKVESDFVKLVTCKTLGARNPTFFNCLGMILVDGKYPNLFEETQHRIGEVSRDPLGRK